MEECFISDNGVVVIVAVAVGFTLGMLLEFLIAYGMDERKGKNARGKNLADMEPAGVIPTRNLSYVHFWLGKIQQYVDSYYVEMGQHRFRYKKERKDPETE